MIENYSKGAKITLVGGGIVGLTTSLVLAKQGFDVHLIEAAPKLGGLYSTAYQYQDYYFDYGSHLPLSTGIPPLDRLMFAEIEASEDWLSFSDTLREYSVFNHALNQNTQCIDARKLAPEDYVQIVAELMNVPRYDAATVAPATNLYDLITRDYGEKLREQVFRPVMRKLTGLELEALSPIAHALHGVQRVVMFDEVQTKELKQIPWYDDRIADTNPRHRVSHTWKYYPKQGGCGAFIAYLEEKCKAAGVTFSLETQVTGLTTAGKKVTHLTLSNGQTIPNELLVWTAPPVFLLRALGVDTTHIAVPKFRPSVLFHYVFDKPALTNGHYVYFYDEAHKSYRTTLYENMVDANTHNHATVEAFVTDRNADLDALAAEIWQEQMTAGLLPPDTQCLHQHVQQLPSGWPDLTNAFFESQEQLRQLVSEETQNCLLLGRASGAHHMVPQLVNMWKQLGDEAALAA